MDIEMFGKISDAFGPSGFEEEVHSFPTRRSSDRSEERRVGKECIVCSIMEYMTL